VLDRDRYDVILSARMVRIIIFALLMWSVCIYAILRGGFSERVVAVSFLCGAGLTQLVVSPYAVRFQHVEIGVLLIDLVVFAIFFAVALFSRKFWPLWITAMQGVGILAHFAPLLSIMPRAYGMAIALWSWPMMVLLAAATYHHHHQMATTGPWRD